MAAGVANFYQALQQTLTAQYPTYLPLEGQNDFNYNWQGLNDPTLFNANTFNQINSILEPGTNSSPLVPTLMLTPAQTFGAGWSALINQMQYVLSRTDLENLNSTNEAAQAQQAAVITAYTQNISPITQDMLTAAQTAMGKAAPVPFTQFNYVVDYTMCWVWSGFTQGLISTPLTYMQIQQGARVPSKLFPRMPAGGASVLAPMTAYLDKVNSVLALQGELSTGTFNVTQLQENTSQPTLTNPQTGMNTVTSTGAPPTTVNAWDIQTSPQEIVNGLGGLPPAMPATSSIQVSVEATQQSANSYSMSINGGASFTVGSGWLTFTGSSEVSYNMVDQEWAGSSYSVNIEYDYPTTVSGIQPMIYDPNTTNGWMWGLALQQALLNYKADQLKPNSAPNNTGYNFLNEPLFDVDKGGNFGYINSLLISLYPTITINYQNGDYNAFTSQFSQSSTGSLKLFGSLTLASGGEATQSMTAEQNSTGQGFTVKIAPPPPTVATGYYDQTACIIAVQPAYPGAAS